MVSYNIKIIILVILDNSWFLQDVIKYSLVIYRGPVQILHRLTH